MTEQFVCPATNEACPTADLCAAANAPLVGAVPHIRREVGGLAWKYTKGALIRELTITGDLVGANFSPTVDRDGSARVCPKGVIEGDFGKKHGPGMAVQAVHNLVAEAVEHLTTDLKDQKERRQP